jgi:hypothetical protein
VLQFAVARMQNGLEYSCYDIKEEITVSWRLRGTMEWIPNPYAARATIHR